MSTAQITVKKLNDAIRKAFESAVSKGLLPEGEIPSFNIEIPADRSHGDLATNAAMVSARSFRSAPNCSALNHTAPSFSYV